jgi:hypothetical protein
MAIDFPNSPTAGDLYTAGGKTWQWNGTFWSAYGTSPVYRVSDTPPIGPSTGDTWYESDTGRLYIYTDSYWVEIGSAGRVTVSANDLTGPSLASNVVSSSLTSVGTLGSLAVTGDLIVDTNVLDVDTTNNRVGINTASPQAALDVQASSGTAMRITNSGTGESFRVEDATGDITPFVIDSSGNVGMGTHIPLARLHITDGSANIRLNTSTPSADALNIVPPASFNSRSITLNTAILTASRTVTLPDATGTVALTSDPGLILVKTQTVGTGVSSVTVTSAFSSTYDNYLITLEGGTISADGDINIKLGASATGYYAFLNYGDFSSNTVLGAARNNQTQFNWVGGGAAGQSAHVHVQVFGPNKAAYTKLLNGTYQSGGGYGTVQGEHRVATAYTDFILTPGAGTLTGGTIRVYGYRNS